MLGRNRLSINADMAAMKTVNHLVAGSIPARAAISWTTSYRQARYIITYFPAEKLAIFVKHCVIFWEIVNALGDHGETKLLSIKILTYPENFLFLSKGGARSRIPIDSGS